jgi:hypothetical protein
MHPRLPAFQCCLSQRPSRLGGSHREIGDVMYPLGRHVVKNSSKNPRGRIPLSSVHGLARRAARFREEVCLTGRENTLDVLDDSLIG